MDGPDYVRSLNTLGVEDVGVVGGKNASLGEMIRHLGAVGVRVPEGFATTADAYRDFIAAGDLADRLRAEFDRRAAGEQSLAATGSRIRQLFMETELPTRLAREIGEAYAALGRELGREDPDVAVRSSATAEDLPQASFAGQQETFLNIRGIDSLLQACRRCYASLFTDRAISYREENGFDHFEVALSIGVQRMVRSDQAGSGVMFSIDTETGFPHAVLINAAWGLGETVVQGTVDPDEYMVFKPLLEQGNYRPIIEKSAGRKGRKMVYADDRGAATELVDTSTAERDSYVLDDDEVLQLARWAVAVERHYGVAMDMEWARDGATGELFIVQARPETVQSRREASMLRSYHLREHGEALARGHSIGDAVAAGLVCRLESPGEIERFVDDAVLVTGMTDPDWVPIMKRAAAIVTDHGGRTSHAAIVS
ncbi:MAG: PEP/pyruvate-binding domain-containing protein, partial [Halofilum sp. (in: g-proteobacteria)]